MVCTMIQPSINASCESFLYVALATSPVYRIDANPLQTFSGPVPSNLTLVQDFHKEHSQKGQFQHLGSKGAQSLSGTSSKMLCRFLDTSADHLIVQAQWHQECNSSWSLGTFYPFSTRELLMEFENWTLSARGSSTQNPAELLRW